MYCVECGCETEDTLCEDCAALAAEREVLTDQINSELPDWF